MSLSREFKTAHLVLDSTAATRGVDAFALALIKTERQLRRLVTHLVFQFPCFDRQHVQQLRGILARSNNVYFDGLERGFDALYPIRIETLVGANHAHLRARLTAAARHRNKIFHGQVTLDGLSRDDLVALVADLEAWCAALGAACVREFGYDGFSDSFRKSPIPHLANRFNRQLQGADDYEAFIREVLEKRRPTRRAGAASHKAS